MIESKLSLDQSVLGDVRRALGRTASVAPAPLNPFAEPTDESGPAELIARFTTEAGAVRANVHLLSDKLQFAGQLVDKIAEICANSSGLEIALSTSDLFTELNLTAALGERGFAAFVADGKNHEKLVARLADCGVGLTTADYAIAETGTIVLSNDEPNALLVSLLPPVHIALLRSSQITATLDRVMSKLGRERINSTEPTRSITLITGPSRTSDVELVLSIGVHGPKQLHVIIMDS